MLLFGLALGLALVDSSIEPHHATTAPGRIAYRLTWRWGRARPEADGWTTVSDRGYAVTIEQGYVVSHGAALVACAEEPRGLRERAAERLPGSLLLPRAVLAGHSGSGREPSQLDRPMLESLLRAEDQDWGTIDLASPEPAYCQGHYAIGLSAADAARMALPASLDGGSLFVAGSYRQGPGDPHRFAIRSTLAWGAVGPLRALEAAGLGGSPEVPSEDPGLRAELAGRAPTLRIERELGLLFDGMDFEQASSDELAKTLLRNLADSARFELDAGSSSTPGRR
ncbi:MAG: hypothetical protein H6648_00055 [Caldilineae bacterium]|nr:hypothetical protein [Chloroflexota bacterium]MCB9175519.1 hypothetical protein [Caldilineae bacterium]